MSDTSTRVKLRWEETVIRTVEAEVDIDAVPDSLIEHGDDVTWWIVEGDVDDREAIDFLGDLHNDPGTIVSDGETETRVMLDDCEVVPPIMVAAAPLPAIGVTIAEDDYLGDLADRAEWRAEMKEGEHDVE